MRTVITLLLLGLLAGCTLGEPKVVYITATPDPASISAINTLQPTTAVGSATQAPVDANGQTSIQPPASVTEYVVQSGDTLTGIAVAYNLDLETLLALNQIENGDLIAVGQIIELPPPPDNVTPNIRLLADAQLVRGQQGAAFDVAAFVAQQPGYIRFATDKVNTNRADGLGVEELLSASDVVARVALEFSVDPRLLLALLEYRAGWLSNPTIAPELQPYPMISEEASGAIKREGLYKQLAWTANELNRGYYNWKYNGWSLLEFDTGERLLFAPNLNAATVGLQHMLHLATPYAAWQRDVSPDGLMVVYQRYFGDPFANDVNPLAGMTTQPELRLPFQPGETWFYTGGAHGGWGGGSAWAAVDFAPPDNRTDVLCYTSAYPATAVASGSIVRSERGTVILDLDGDNNETTGWTILYLHIAAEGRIPVGARVEAGAVIGYPACEGGFSTATHLHIARRYNGEWLPSQCLACKPEVVIPQFAMSGWGVFVLRNQEYQGFLGNINGEQRRAEQGRLSPDNRITW
ncbi:MAG: LysM peptidoglycan-binding domain-containing protein [Armatimonadetes bacterium]|nr:LysM peptidoglycan-binding domain-containing protein [Anaerolineae bacterium]